MNQKSKVNQSQFQSSKILKFLKAIISNIQDRKSMREYKKFQRSTKPLNDSIRQMTTIEMENNAMPIFKRMQTELTADDVMLYSIFSDNYRERTGGKLNERLKEISRTK